jgi:hypothetical protein
MRFVRAYTDPAGDIVHTSEREALFEEGHAVRIRLGDGTELPLVEHELGFLEDFGRAETLDGRPCSCAEHIRERLELAAAGDVEAYRAKLPNGARGPGGRFKVKPGATLPRLHPMPTSLEGIKERMRQGGPASIPAMARAWLARVLPDADARELGVRRGVPLSVLKSVELVRARRHPAESNVAQLERLIQERADVASEQRRRARAAKPGQPPRSR